LPRDVGVVIVAAGQGTRIGGPVPKQYRELAGVPMLLRALRPFVAHPDVAHTVIVLPAVDAERPPAWLGELLGGTLSVVAGGAERSDSVAHGLAALPGPCTTVLVHDAARPFIARETIDAVIAVARRGEGAVPASPLGDTLKESTDGGAPAGRVDALPLVQRTIPRDRLWRAQTPQGFPRAVLEEAHARARRDGLRGTDDAMLVERLGLPVRLIPGSDANFKVTSEADLLMAEAILVAQRRLADSPNPTR
jgi:2-C-methyl-D-erythritol 4-phosphate cytidylyltransferase